MPADLAELAADLLAERAALDAVLAAADDAAWALPTPAAGWNVTDQVTHLAFFDDVCRRSVEDPDGFRAERGEIADITGHVDAVAAAHRRTPPTVARAWLDQSGRALVAAALSPAAPRRVPWFGPDMGLVSAISARLMETWAHGLDVADALGVTMAPTARLRHVAHLGVLAFANSFVANGLPVPDAAIRVELTGPSGESWRYGPDDAEQWVRGEAFGFCAVVTQRRHRADTDLVAHGSDAERWLSVAQAFAGPPGAGREPQRPT